MSEMKKVRLGDIAEVTMGQSPKSEYYNSEKQGIPFLQGNRTFGRRYPVFDTYTTLSTKMAKAGDVIMSVRAPVGDLNFTPVDMCLGRGVCSIRMKNGNHEYLFYLLKYNMPLLLNRENGSVFGSVNRNDIIGLELNIVDDSDEQKKIARYLSMIDDKIEKNDKINNNLLEQAQTLYNQYFPYSISDKLSDGWRLGTVGEIIEIHDSKRIPLSGAERMSMENKIYPYYGAASLMDYVDNFIFDGKYLLMGEDGTVVDDLGYPILQYVWGQFWVNNHAHVLTGKRGFNVESLYMLFKRTPVKSIVTGAVQQKISQANLRSIQVVIPPEATLIEYNNQIEPLFALLRTNEAENRSLSVLRDTLLPKLMNGDIDVSTIQL
ncbi:MAG: restriction endonuclease subunit S [Lachnospiraceae bacterium]|nr:restriction endonuclease subunit S [Lachnospiraceae bacterium]